SPPPERRMVSRTEEEIPWPFGPDWPRRTPVEPWQPVAAQWSPGSTPGEAVPDSCGSLRVLRRRRLLTERDRRLAQHEVRHDSLLDENVEGLFRPVHRHCSEPAALCG